MYEVYKMYKVCKVFKVLLPPAPQASYATSVGFLGIYIKLLLFFGQGEKTCVPEGSGRVPEDWPEGNTHIKITLIV